MKSQLIFIALLVVACGVSAETEFTHAKTGADFEVVGNSANYLAWDEENVLPELSKGCVHFKVQGKNDAHILLSPTYKVPRSSVAYEIVLGGWGNTKSVIRYGTQGIELDSYPKNWKSSGAVLSATESRDFWISLVDGEISVGKGLICYRFPIMTATFSALSHPEKRIDNVKYIAFAGWDTPVSFTKVDVDHARSDMMQFMAPGTGGRYRVFNHPNVMTVSAENFEFSFWVRGDAALLALLPTPGPVSADGIEIHLDAKNGTAAQIYHGTQSSGKAKLLYTFKTDDLVDKVVYHRFWVRKYGVGLAVGLGEKVGQRILLNAVVDFDWPTERFTVGFSGLDYPTTWKMIAHRDLPILDEDDVQANLDDYFDSITENHMETEMYTKGKKFNKKLYEEWQLSTGEKNLDSEDQDAWEDLQYKLAAQGDPDAISIMMGTAKKPRFDESKVSKKDYETAEY